MPTPHIRSDYALRVLVDLAAQGPAQLREIAERHGLPVPFMKAIISDLAKHGLVATQRGRGGGMALGRPPADIRVWEIKQALGEDGNQVGCPDTLRPCILKDRCPICAFWQRASQELIALQQATTIADFLEPRENPCP